MSEGDRDKYGHQLIAIMRMYDDDGQGKAFRLLLLVVARLVGDVYAIKKRRRIGMKPEQLEEIRERAQCATEAPWQIADTTDGLLILGEDDWIIGGTFERRQDAVFTKHAREDIPALLAEIERLQGLLNIEEVNGNET